MKKKRFISFVISAALAVTCLGSGLSGFTNKTGFLSGPMTAAAEIISTEKTSGDLVYVQVDTDEDGTYDYIEISDCDESAVSVDIPSEIDGLPVTSIGDSAFWKCTSLTYITIPDSVTSIGDYAFDGCSSLERITIENPACEIYDTQDTIVSTAVICGYWDSTAHDYALKYDREFVSLDGEPLIGDANGDGAVNIRDAAYIASKVVKKQISELSISADFNGDGIINIRDSANIARYLVSSGGGGSQINSGSGHAISIGSAECHPGETVSIPIDVVCNDILESAAVHIGWYGSGLQPASVSGSGSVVFSSDCGEDYCSLAVFSYAPIKDGTVATIDFTIPEDAEDGTVYDIYFSAIDTFAEFEGDDFADSVPAVGGTITVLEEEPEEPAETTPAVTTTAAPTETTVSATTASPVTTEEEPGSDIIYLSYDMIDEDEDGVYDYVEINGCSASAVSVRIPSKIEGLPVRSIGMYAFEECSALKSITIPDSVTTIGNSAFYKCSGLTDVTIGNGVTDIEDSAFYGCTSLESITIPENVSSLGGYAFFNCTGLKSVIINNPDCDIYYNKYTISDTAEIYGYQNSTAQAYAEEYNRTFIDIAPGPGTTTPAATTAVTTSATTASTTSSEVTTSDDPAEKTTVQTTAPDIPDPSPVTSKTTVNTDIFDVKESNGTIIIINCHENVINVIVPSEINDLIVSKINDFAFSSKVIETITFKNPNVEIADSKTTINESAVIYGYWDSTAHDYAEKYGREFVSLDGEPDTLQGDANGDNIVNVRDAAFIAQKLAQGKADELPDSADYNGDGNINVRDAAAIAKFLATGEK